MDKQSGRFPRGTNRLTECVLLSVHREITWLCVVRVFRRAGERVSVCISVFADLFLWAFLVCVCSLMCAYMCRADITSLWQSSQNHSLTHCAQPLCDILTFIFPLWPKSKSLLSLAQLSPFGKEWTQWVLILFRDVLRYVFFFLNKALRQLFIF